MIVLLLARGLGNQASTRIDDLRARCRGSGTGQPRIDDLRASVDVDPL